MNKMVYENDARQTGGTVNCVLADRWAVIPFLTRPAALAPAEDDWREAAVLTGFRKLRCGEAADPDSEIRICCGRETVYFRITAFGLEERDESSLRFEQIDLIISTNGSGEGFYQIPLTLSNRRTDTEAGLAYQLRWDHFGPEKSRLPLAESDYGLQVYAEESGIVAELSVPLAALGMRGAKQGNEWRFNAVRYREGEEPVTSWVPLLQAYYMDSAVDVRPDQVRPYVVGCHSAGEGRLGSLFFGSLPASLGMNAELDRSTHRAWIPADLTLRYRTFAEKDLSFQGPEGSSEGSDRLDIFLRGPSGVLSAADQVGLKREGARWIASFRHSPIEDDGVVQLLLLFKAGADDERPAYFGIVTYETERMVRAGIALHQAPDQPVERRKVPKAPPSEHVRRIIGLIPERVGFLFAGVPHDLDARTDRVYAWSPERPHELTAIRDGKVYPNADYPEERSIVVRNRLGDEVVYPYYEDGRGRKYFVSAHIWYEQKKYALSATKEIAETDPLGAARILRAWVKAYAGYVPVNDFIWRNYPVDPRRTPPFPYWGGMFERWFIMELYALIPLAEAYAAVRRTDAFETLREETGEDVERLVADELFRPELDFADSYPVVNGNMDCVHWLGQITLGKALGDPDQLHRTALRMKRLYELRFLADGLWNEIAFSYHDQIVSGFADCLDAMEGWSDPAGYVSPRSGARFDRLNRQTEFPALARSMSLGAEVTYPDGRYWPINDTWAFDRHSGSVAGRPFLLLPSSRIAMLARGSGAKQTQLIVNFSPKYGHHHADPLGLLLYAEGRELLPDIGYTYTRYRLLFNSTFAHNTVVVNGRDMELSGAARHGGKIGLFAPADRTVQLLRASQESAYPGITDVYSRELWSVGFEDEDEEEAGGYIVDLFRVSGGSRHEYTINGPANEDAVLDTELPLAEYGPYLVPPGTKVVEPASEYDKGDAGGEYYGYMYLQQVRRAALEEGRYDITMTTESGAGMKFSGFAGTGESELFVGTAASLRATRTGDKKTDINDQLGLYRLPKYVLRREGRDLKSLFQTVMEPYAAGHSPRIESLRRLETEGGRYGDTAIAITYGDTTDLIMSSGVPGQPLTVGDMTLQGCMGFIRMRGGQVCRMRLIGGTLLRAGDTVLTGEGPVTGKVTGTKRKAAGDRTDGFVTDAIIPDNVIGTYMVVTHPDGQTSGYRIADLIRCGGETILTTDFDPGFEIKPDGTSVQRYIPHLAWGGEHHFRIDNIERMDVG